MNEKYLYYTVFAISTIIGLFSYNSISEVYEKRHSLDLLSKKISTLEKENANLEADLEYKKTEDFVINEARLKLNYGFKNEQMYLVPKERQNTEDALSEGEKVQNAGGSNSETIQPSGIEINQNVGLPVYKIWVNTLF